jgi:hypothetical protein
VADAAIECGVRAAVNMYAAYGVVPDGVVKTARSWSTYAGHFS